MFFIKYINDGKSFKYFDIFIIRKKRQTIKKTQLIVIISNERLIEKIIKHIIFKTTLCWHLKSLLSHRILNARRQCNYLTFYQWRWKKSLHIEHKKVVLPPYTLSLTLKQEPKYWMCKGNVTSLNCFCLGEKVELETPYIHYWHIMLKMANKILLTCFLQWSWIISLSEQDSWFSQLFSNKRYTS